MLSPADADLVHRDSTLEGLAVLLDPEAFIAALRLKLPEIHLEKAQLVNIRYKPAMNCLVTYRLDVAGTTLYIYAKSHGHDRRIKLKKARELKSIAGPLGKGRILIEDDAIVVSIFPNDSKLKALRRLGDEIVRKRLLRKLFRSRPDLWDGTLATLQYKPERRYVARLETAEGPHAVLKFYTPLAYPTALINATAFRSQGHLQIPQCIGYSEPYKVLAFEWLPGSILSEILAGDLDLAVQAVHDTGRALAEFHTQEAGIVDNSTQDMEAMALTALGDWLGFICPHLACRAKCLAERLVDHLAREPPVSRPIHGDFYAKQVLVAKGRIAILDMDEAIRGDPGRDLGLFIAHLECDALGGRLPSCRVAPLKEALLEGYQEGTGGLLPDIKLYVALGLFKLAPQPFRCHEPDWARRTEAILDRIETIINSLLSGEPKLTTCRFTVPEKITSGIPVADPFGAAKDVKMPFLSQALNPVHAERFLSHMFLSRTDKEVQIKLRQIRVVRYKPGRRCLVEYELEVMGPETPHEVITLLGKARAKGLDIATYRLCEALWISGFHEESYDGISVPQPIGVVPELNMWFQLKVQGTPATDLLMGSDGIELAGRIAEAIHKVHRLNIPARRRHTMADELSILRERLAAVAENNPMWKDRIEWVLAACHRLGSSMPEPGAAGIHRDFYPGQVIVNGNRIYLVDFDLYCEGDPGLDIGNFAGHLQEQALRMLGNPRGLADQESAMVKRFIELSGGSVCRSVEVYTTLTLVRHIHISMQFPERRHFTEALLTLCEQRLSEQIRQSG